MQWLAILDSIVYGEIVVFKSFEGSYVGIFVGIKDFQATLRHLKLSTDERIGRYGYISHTDGTRSLAAAFPYRYRDGTYVSLVDTISIYKDGEDKPLGQSWLWDGNYEKPTLTPSLDSTDASGCGWHGFLTAGAWQGM